MANDTCPRCNGTKKVIRGLCEFLVEIDCDKCNGVGTLSPNGCTKCNGVGTTVTSYDLGGGQTREPCGQCGGSGNRTKPIGAPEVCPEGGCGCG